MEVIETTLKDCYILKPSAFGDERGYFRNAFDIGDIKNDNIKFENLVKVNQSLSSKGVLRGLHFQKDPYCQAKIVGVLTGSAIDVVVDIRENSPTYGQCTSLLLKPYNTNDPESGCQLMVPRGFAHGFIALEDNTLFQYYCDNEYAKDYEGGITYKCLDEEDFQKGTDPLANLWAEIFRKYNIENPLTSEKDAKHLTLSKSPKYFKY